jgi:hypothetical protein
MGNCGGSVREAENLPAEAHGSGASTTEVGERENRKAGRVACADAEVLTMLVNHQTRRGHVYIIKIS